MCFPREKAQEAMERERLLVLREELSCGRQSRLALHDFTGEPRVLHWVAWGCQQETQSVSPGQSVIMPISHIGSLRSKE